MKPTATMKVLLFDPFFSLGLCQQDFFYPKLCLKLLSTQAAQLGILFYGNSIVTTPRGWTCLRTLY